MKWTDTFQLIQRAILEERPAQAYLIVGPVRGIGMDLAVRILQTLFCRAANRPCCACEACRRVEERIEADVHWLFPEMKSRVIGVEPMREKMLRAISQTSLAGGWKAGVLVGADRLNAASANTFLKTLEEPPPRTLFLLLSDAPQHLLPTIVSRCQKVDLEAVRELEEPWRGRLTETLASPLYGRPLERLASASLLLAILGEMKEKAEQRVREEAQAESKVEEDSEVFDARVSARYQEMRLDFLMTLNRWFRDLFVLRAGGEASLLQSSLHHDLLAERAARLTLAQTLDNLSVLEELARQMDRNLPEEAVLACALDRLHHGVA